MTGSRDDVGWKARLKELGLARKQRARSAPPPPAAPAQRVDKTAVGRRGEEEAAAYLARHGVLVVERNVRFPDGELDLVAREGETLVFVEVKSRADGSMGRAAEAVTRRKRARVVRAARRYLNERKAGGRARRSAPETPVRFDVVAIEREPLSIDWIRGAFDASDATPRRP